MVADSPSRRRRQQQQQHFFSSLASSKKSTVHLVCFTPPRNRCSGKEWQKRKRLSAFKIEAGRRADRQGEPSSRGFVVVVIAELLGPWSGASTACAAATAASRWSASGFYSKKKGLSQTTLIIKLLFASP